MERLSGLLFDVYHFEEMMQLWIRTTDGRAVLLRDTYRPVFYARGSPDMLEKLTRRLIALDALAEAVSREERLLLYENTPALALKFTLKRPSLLSTIRRKLYAFYGKMDLYHTDIELPTGYMYAKNLYPLAEVEVLYNATDHSVASILCTSDIAELDYSIPDFRLLRLGFEKSSRLPIAENCILIQAAGQDFCLSGKEQNALLALLTELLNDYDPDVILSSAGDQTLMPFLFTLLQKNRTHLPLDRDPFRIQRRIIHKGSSYNTYGSWIYRAPSYPLYGRWHIDRANSFVYKEAELAGILELARISRVPVQRLARSSTGAALTCMETNVALKKGYLVPWQKSKVEAPRTAYDLLRADKGGLVFVPQSASCYENVAQLDFSQMYPTIMDQHNISPETINCSCCSPGETVPGLSSHICSKRRGVVSDTLRDILARRAYYKKQMKNQNISVADRAIYDARQNSLKWMLVTSFGYLGYRNAKFGRLESHEAVTAFGREKLLKAILLAEEQGFSLLHAITDCLFLSHEDKRRLNEPLLQKLCARIADSGGIAMSIDGIYSWVYFLESRTQKGLAVMNRYFGRFQDGTLKIRGIAARRSDTCAFIRKAQLSWLELMARADSLQALQEQESQLEESYRSLAQKLRNRAIDYRDLLVTRKASRQLDDYAAATPAMVVMQDLREWNIEIQPGQRVRYLVLEKGETRYISEEKLLSTPGRAIYDRNYYKQLLQAAYLEIRPDSRLFENQPDLWEIQ